MSHTLEGSCRVCAHHVSFWFRGEHEITDDIKKRLEEHAEERIKDCIIDDYSSGELCYEDDKHEFHGWWAIVSN
jgi:hypothetical protein